MVSKILILVLVPEVISEYCYWNKQNPYSLFSSKTPYESIRGDIREYHTVENCRATGLWSLHRHGNRNPSSDTTEQMKVIATLKDDIIASYDAGVSQLCSQDIDEFRKWTWNETLEVSQSYLTGVGYKELYDLASRLKQKYPQLLQGTPESFYFRPTNTQRTITSAIAFVHGLTAGANLNLTIDKPRKRDGVIQPYANCRRYREEVRRASGLKEQMADYLASDEYIDVQNRVQERLGIAYQLNREDIYALYDMCRFYRSWTATHKSPWCSVFADQDLAILEYKEDVKHYYRNGYGSAINGKLGCLPLRNLYESFDASIKGQGKNIISYFTHDTMMEMTYCALGLFKDQYLLLGSRREKDRLWRTSYTAAFATNFIAVLNSCTNGGLQSYRVQLFVNEKVTTLCPVDGCTWQEFQQVFQQFADADLDFCN